MVADRQSGESQRGVIVPVNAGGDRADARTIPSRPVEAIPPKNIITKLNAAAMDALADSTVRRRLADLAQEIPPYDQQTPQALGAHQKAEIDKWWPIMKAANIKGE